MTDKTAVAACTCIVILYGIDYAIFGGSYFDALVRAISNLYARFG